MNAIEFSNKLNILIKEFFSLCLEREQLSIQKIQDIEFSHYDKGFTLKLESEYCIYLQGFSNDNIQIIPLFFNVVDKP